MSTIVEMRNAKRRKLANSTYAAYDRSCLEAELFGKNFSLQASQDSLSSFSSSSSSSFFNLCPSSSKSLTHSSIIASLSGRCSEPTTATVVSMEIEELSQELELKHKKMNQVSNYKSDYFKLEYLPREIQALCLSNLDKNDLLQIRTVSKSLSSIIDNHLVKVIVSPHTDMLSKEDMKNIVSKLSHHGENVYGFNFSRCSKIHTMPLHQLPSTIKYLDLSNHKNITNSTIGFFPRNVIQINISRCNKISDEGLSKLPEKLQILNISACPKISNDGMKNLPPHLKSLDISRTDLTDLALQHMSEIKSLTNSLQILNISGCSKITDAGLKYLNEFKNLNQLRMESLSISDIGISYLPRKSLLHLNIADCFEITAKGISFLPESIIQLNLGFRCLTPESFKNLPKNIQQLHLPFCGIQDESLSLLPTSVRHLDVSFSNIGDEGLKNLPPKLKYLNISGCFNLTSKGFHNLPDQIDQVVFQYNHLNTNDLSTLPQTINFSIHSILEECKQRAHNQVL